MSQASTALESKPGPLDVGDLICVSAPYFALRDLVTTGPGQVEATVPVEQEPERQAAPITIGEAGRHLAILGLCGAATVNPMKGRHFYLAAEATCDWLAPPTSDQAWPLRARAITTFTGRRRATADTELMDASGRLLARMTIGYMVISERTFDHLFPLDPQLVPPQVNPYSRTLPFPEPVVTDGRVQADLLVDAAMCAGHFKDRPMLPVAVAAGGLTTLAERLLQQRAGTEDIRWSATRVALQARRLARAGTKLTFTAETDPENEGRFLGTILADDEIIATAEMDAALH